MKIRNIPETVTINDGPYAGRYTKRQGSRNDRTLSCWFGEEMGSGMPHISIHQESEDQDFRYFHVTFPTLKLITVSTGSWRDKTAVSEQVQQARYHVYLEIDERDMCVIVERDNTSQWKRVPFNKRNVSLSFDDMDKKAVALGDWFYAAALFS